MRVPRLTTRDFVATGLVAVAALLFGLDRAGVGIPGAGSTRGLSVVIFVLGFAACITGADPEAFAPTTPRLSLTFTGLLGTTTLAAGIVAMVTGSASWQVVLLVAIVAMWLVATIRRTVAVRPGPQAPEREHALPREKVGV